MLGHLQQVVSSSLKEVLSFTASLCAEECGENMEMEAAAATAAGAADDAVISPGHMMSTDHSVFRRICVFCGSSSGNKKVYIDAAVKLGNEFVSSSGLLRTVELQSSTTLYI